MRFRGFLRVIVINHAPAGRILKIEPTFGIGGYFIVIIVQNSRGKGRN